jgi:hypothetical protein
MDEELGDEIVSRLIGVSVSFQYFEQTIYINPFVKVELSRTIYSSSGNDSYFKICFNPFDFIPNISFSIFDIKPRARELGMKLKPLIDDGEIFINSFRNLIRITVNVYKSKWGNYADSGSVAITIIIPPSSNREGKRFKNEDAQNVQKAFAMGALAIGGIILFKVIKGGIGAIVAGPVGAAIGFAT